MQKLNSQLLQKLFLKISETAVETALKLLKLLGFSYVRVCVCMCVLYTITDWLLVI